ncbi:MAG TPA: DUF3025 domain-containing protein [Candidatus Accumulibacter phosphatis]|nr:MAG: hypothetical protein AW07_00695 [Candidatus Accumulibacter sp. SK-11]HAY26829.1 DUF3025 domain-containing protein [Accumulibacter sp.]HCV12407.1 DUF3025 domain-containing protein [Accumulibacter sp.]HRL74394.1 DUF3025 domain-containing protein [Candidatus Accumulibacter phosphatis]HRQ95964.1 DUF3025 domain-containing protein [Candidatus Accumulibacter phosphatis]
MKRAGPSSAGGLFAPLLPLFDLLPLAPDLPALAVLGAARELRNAAGRRITFVPPPADDLDYETRIWLTGEVATRPDNWHDFFNALVWFAFPLTKAVLNARHAELRRQQSTLRCRERDTLTHFDECGVAVIAGNPELLDLVRGFHWRSLFWERRSELSHGLRCLVFGHATYEQLRRPFRGLTAKAVLYQVSPDWLDQPLAAQVADVDRRLAAGFAGRQYLTPRVWQPLPLLGLPGVTPENESADYYDDQWQFRPGRSRCPV